MLASTATVKNYTFHILADEGISHISRTVDYDIETP